MLERIPDGRRKPSALVMCPTRELAIQVAQEFEALAKHRDLSVVAIYGGASMGEQLDKLKAGAEIVVGTPGRIFDHIRRKTLVLEECLVSVLDEADEMLNMGFFEEVTRILDHLPSTCQQLLFSATVPADIEQIIRQYLTEPETILLSGDEYRVDNIHNVLYHTVDAYPKPRNLLYMIEQEEPETAIVFCNTRSDTSLVSAVLNRNGYDAELLNGDLPQKERERVMAKVKRGEVRFMVATDIAARGIDISDLSHVVNYSLPEDPSVFMHRVGRTGRIGKKGTSLSLVSGRRDHDALGAAEEVQHRLRGAQAADAGGGQGALDRAPRRRAEGGHERLHLRGLHPAGAAAQGAPRRRVPDGLRAQVLLRAPPHREDDRPAEGRAQAGGARAQGVAGEELRPRPRARGAWPARRSPRRARPRSAARPRGSARPRGAGPARSRGPREERPRPPRAERPAEVEADLAGIPTIEVSATLEEAAERTAPPARQTPAREVSAERAAPAGREEGGEARAERPARGRIFISWGEEAGADEAKVRELVAASVPGTELLLVELRRSHTFVEVAPEAVDPLVTALNGKVIGDKPITAERARRRRRR